MILLKLLQETGGERKFLIHIYLKFLPGVNSALSAEPFIVIFLNALFYPFTGHSTHNGPNTS